MAEPNADPPANPGPAHPLLVSLQPLLARVRGEVVPPGEMTRTDVPLVWEGEVVAAVRLPPGPAGEPSADGTVADLDLLLAEVARELGGPLAELGRSDKQHAVRLLEERGAFRYRKSAESVAEALGVTRFTVYNYLNRNRG